MKIENIVFDLIMKRISVDNVQITYQRHISAVLENNGKDFNLITIGYNTRFKTNNCTFHAEEDALLKFKDTKPKNKKISLIVIRISRNSNSEEYKLSLSKPCFQCISYISTFKIKTIYYSIEGGIVKEKIRNLIDGEKHISKFYRNKYL